MPLTLGEVSSKMTERVKPIFIHFIKRDNGTSPAPPQSAGLPAGKRCIFPCGNMFFIHFIRGGVVGRGFTPAVSNPFSFISFGVITAHPPVPPPAGFACRPRARVCIFPAEIWFSFISFGCGVKAPSGRGLRQRRWGRVRNGKIQIK